MPQRELPQGQTANCGDWLIARLQHGTESDSSFQGYANGNKEPGKGFGHIAISVKDINAACERFEKLGVKFQKKLSDGGYRMASGGCKLNDDAQDA